VRANVLAVRSRNAGADSNLTVLGASGNVYNFYLRSETWNSTQVTDLTVYLDAPRELDDGSGGSGSPSDAALPAAGAGMPDYLRRIVFRPEDLRFDMKMFIERDDDAEIAPEHVFEDGIFTYFDYGDRADSVPRPVIHQLVDGVDTVVNTRTAGPRGTIVVAEAVGDFTLRNGTRVVCVRRVAPARSDDTAGSRATARHANGRENRE
jgi:type IV secretory pathway VirB9-like protein